jgi:rRNA maturation endonuclease Nob1
MKDFIKSFLIGLALVASGIAMIETPFSGDEEYELAAYISMPIFGVMLLGAGIFFLAPAIQTIKSRISSKKENLKNAIANAGKEPEDLFSNFRAEYSSFLISGAQVENPDVQNHITQVFRNIIELRRNRLKRMNVLCHFKSIRKSHSSLPPVLIEEYSDGKYQIEDVKEDIAATTDYLKDNKVIYTRTNNDIARYTVASAKYVSENKIICPNCGSEQTKEQLLDGCDYCGTKFMVEDFSEKITDFALRSDYELQYSRYKEARKKFTPYVGFAVEAVVCVAYILYMIFNCSQLRQESGAGVLTMIFGGILIAVIAALPFTFIMIGLFNAFVFPVIQIGASLTYVSKKILDKQKSAERNNQRMQKTVRAIDPYFSLSSFYSNVQNKLASVCFADTNSELNAFASSDLSYLKDRYKNVIDIQTEYISLKNYSVEKGLQKARVEAEIKLVSYDGVKCSVKNETVNILFTKSSACKTQVVCAPSLLRCKGCGASLSLLEGKKCKYCGQEMDLEQHDWVIREFKV